MTAPGATDPRAYPAPGSATPGAPPPLKRALTPADGVADVASVQRGAVDTEVPAAQAVSVTSPSGSRSRLVAAAAMFGVAAGLEIAGVLSRSRRR